MSVSFSLPDGITDSLPPGGEAFLDEVSARVDPTEVHSVLLFGSVIEGRATPVSDVDLIIVLDDEFGDKRVEYREILSSIARRHIPVSEDRRRLERILERATGMFQSGFVTTRSAIERGDFPEIFNTSRLAFLMAPWRTTLGNVFESAVRIYGEAVQPDWDVIGHPEDHRLRELWQSMVTATLLSGAQVGYGLVSDRATLYAMEAYKWSWYNGGFHMGREYISPEERHKLLRIPRWYDARFVRLRREPTEDWVFLLTTPVIVIWIHLCAITSIIRRDSREGDAEHLADEDQ